MSEANARNVLVLGASGLIGRFVTDDLRQRGFAATGVARKFFAGQRISALDLEMPCCCSAQGFVAAPRPAIVLMVVALLMLDNR